MSFTVHDYRLVLRCVAARRRSMNAHMHVNMLLGRMLSHANGLIVLKFIES